MPFITGYLQPDSGVILAPGDNNRLGLPSASSQDRNLRCVVAFVLGKRVKPRRDPKLDQYAKKGTDLHVILAGEGEIDGLNDYEAGTVKMASSIEARLVDKNSFEGSVEILREVRIWAAPNGVKAFSGAPDLVMLKPVGHGYEALIANYKTLRGKQIPIEENYQMMTEALLVSLAFPEVMRVYAALIQPRAPMGQPQYQERTIEIPEIAQFAKFMAEQYAKAPVITHETNLETLPYNPDPERQCKFCDYAHECVGLKKYLRAHPPEPKTKRKKPMPIATAEPTLIKPEVLDAQTKGLEIATAQQLKSSFAEYFTRVQPWAEKAKTIHVTNANQTEVIAEARECRLKLRAIRIETETTRKRLKEDSLRLGKAIDGFANILKAIIEPAEQHLQDQEDFAERQEEARKAALKAEREAKLKPYGVEVEFYQLGEMTEEAFQQLLTNTIAAEEGKKVLAQKAEQERIDREMAEQEERERMKKDKEAAEAQAAKELQAREAAEAELRKVEADRQAKEKADREAKEAEERAAAEAAAAPDNAKIKALAQTVRDLSVPAIKNKAKENAIKAKVAELAAWIDGQATTRK